MGRRVLTGLASLCALLTVPAAAAAIVISPDTHVAVRPGTVHPGTAVTVSFRQPSQAGLLPDEQVMEGLGVTGPAHATGCVHSAARTLARAAGGTMIHRTIRPANGAQWCLGRFHGRVTLSLSPRCNPGPVAGRMHLCPMYVVAPRTIATFSFRVTAR